MRSLLAVGLYFFGFVRLLSVILIHSACGLPVSVEAIGAIPVVHLCSESDCKDELLAYRICRTR